MAVLGAPGDFDTLRVTDRRIGLRRSENTPVSNAADERSLTLGLLVLSSRVANVVPGLSPANILTRNGLVGHLGRIGESERGEGYYREGRKTTLGGNV